MQQVRSQPKPPLNDLLMRHLPGLLGELDAATLEMLREHLQWVEIAAGQPLMRQGDPGDALYLLLRGRLRTYISDADTGEQRMVREISRGQFVGEISLYTDEPRSATLITARDSVLVRLGKPEFERLLALNSHVSQVLTRQIIQRLRTESSPVALGRTATITLLPISEETDLTELATGLAGQLKARGPAVTVAQVDSTVSIQELDEIEANHDFVLLVADPSPSAWNEYCARHCDELLLVANAAQAPVLHANEHALPKRNPAIKGANETLVLLHPSEPFPAKLARHWMALRPARAHLELKPDLSQDLARLANRVSGQSGLPIDSGKARQPAGWRFDRFEAHAQERHLLMNGQPVALGSRAFDLLLALLERPGRLVTKGELLEWVWPGLVVEENNVAAQVAALRKVLGPKLISTVAGYGYRLNAEPERIPAVR
ncbi:cyclic nucleotide-binding domain-containing protein [Paucibacter sp. AS339]|uniref:cyclic nucleotide-binding domain-containing protein n=1 Tax=Paucibacter hankyongi TaxID=3133434 RepID=UPI0030B2E8FA